MFSLVFVYLIISILYGLLVKGSENLDVVEVIAAGVRWPIVLWNTFVK